ncbi:MaoC/PaaZ C-terminal domain-containing protein [Bradyrhizobium sp. S3.5.5]|uniref:MaoC/PaaZ C-terminal domain-containing protein n=1 Tax=unclassified Bradyrhizobium TaxID=2631580 RepID=UPI0033923DA3
MPGGPEPLTQAKVFRVARAIDLAAFVGTELAPGRWRSVTQEEVDQFVVLTGERNWVHTDVDRAMHELDGGTTIVPGQLLLALVPALLQEAYVVVDAAQSRAAALRAVRFRFPVRPGDVFRLRARFDPRGATAAFRPGGRIVWPRTEVRTTGTDVSTYGRLFRLRQAPSRPTGGLVQTVATNWVK